jgi:mannose-6-phosphate isomerase
MAAVLGKKLGPEADYGESWEISDHGDDQSLVDGGAWHGRPLGTLVREHAGEILGRHQGFSCFPLLMKFLDAQQNLSLQVHPNDEQAAIIVPPDFGKTEAWFVLHVEPGSTIYAGLKSGVDRKQLEDALHAGTATDCIHRLEPKVGDCIFLPAGAVHALGEGILVAEVQQSSNVTYRLFDWNRVGPDGKPRQLHLERGLDAVDFALGPIAPQKPQPTGTPGVTRLVACDKFIMDHFEIDAPATLGGDDRFHIVQPLAGELRVEGDASVAPLKLGDTCLLPAGLGKTKISSEGKCAFLDYYLP